MFKTTLKRTLQNQKREEGQGLVEYALILVLVAVVVIVVLSLVGPGVGNIFSQIVTALNAGAEGDLSEVADVGGCKQALVNWWVIVEPDGSVPAGNLQYSDAECAGSNNGGITFDSVYIAGGGDAATATSMCNNFYGKGLRSAPDEEIWAGSGFWYCQP